MIVYLDTSVVLRFLLNQPPILAEWGRWEEAYSSAIFGVEMRRTIDRLRLAQTIADKQTVVVQREVARVEAGISTLAVNPAVLSRASEPMPVPLATLDALHLASALMLRERHRDLIFATHDVQLGRAAVAFGFTVTGCKV